MKAKVDVEKCIGCGTCVALCDAVFELYHDEKFGAERARVKEGADCDTARCCQIAADGCPTLAIEVVNE